MDFIGANPPITEDDIEAVEHRLGQTLPEPYRRHLLRHNGGRPERTGFDVVWPEHADAGVRGWTEGQVDYFYGVHDQTGAGDLLSDYETDRGMVPDDTLAFASDPGGNPLLIGLYGPNRGRVFFALRHDGSSNQTGPADRWDNVGHVADDFDSFVAALRPEE